MSDIASIAAIGATLVSGIAALYSFFTTKKRHEKLKLTYSSLEKTYQKLFEGEINKKLDIEEISEFKSVILPIINQATKAIHELSRKEVSSAIKLLYAGDKDEDLNLVTFLRDSHSTRNREILDFKYPINSNIAYKTILSSYDKYFLDNDIANPSEGGYVNDTREIIESLYRSALVLPLVAGKDEQHKHILGFLTFDSKEKNAFGSDSVEYAKKVSELISMYMKKSLYDADSQNKGITNGSTGRS
jgi:hypothetical protein